MSDWIIKAERLGKRFQISHEPRERYRALRDVVSERVRGLLRPRKRADAPATEEFWALRDVSFQVAPGEVIGIVGRNGAGKSTLLKVLSRITEPSAGRVTLRGRVSSLLEVGTGFHPELTGRENVFLNGAILGMSRREVRSRLDEIVSFAEVERFLDTPVKRYSSGMYMRLAFSVAAHLNPELLLIDEVLAVGDDSFQKRCIQRMAEIANSGRTVIFVSHNLAMVETLTARGILLEKGRIAIDGPIRTVLDAYMGSIASTEATFGAGCLRSVRASVEGDRFFLVAEFNSAIPIRLPNLGFVVSDLLGRPIFGTNPFACGVPPLDTAVKEGSVRCEIRAPRLLSGTYRISIWFGNETEDFVVHRECLALEIHGNAGPRQQDPRTVGPVIPEISWSFDVR